MIDAAFPYEACGPVEVSSVLERGAVRRETWRFEGSLGDPVSADLWVCGEPWAVVLIGHGRGGSRSAQYVAGSAMHWSRRGIAVVAADAPGHGDRAGTATVIPPVGTDAASMERWVRDQRMLLDAVAARFGGRPIGFVGFSMGAMFGVPLVAADARVAAGVFALAGSTAVVLAVRHPHLDGDEAVRAALDPARFAPAVAPRPALVVCAADDEVVPREASEALFAAFRPPREMAILPGGHTEWHHPARWNRRMLRFLTERLA